MSIKNLIGKIPGVEYPKEELSIGDRIKWTIGIAVLVLIMGSLPLPMSPDTLPYSYPFLFTMLTIGIGPIVTAITLLQLLMGANIIRLDLGKSEDRLFFYGMQKMLIVFLAFFEASAVLIGFHLASTLSETIILMSILILGTISLMYMDEIVLKWGLGSGIGLFISVGAIKILLYGLPNFLNRWINWAIFDISLIYPVVATAFIVMIIYIGFRRKIEFPVSTEIVSGRYSMKFFYISYVPLILVGALLANIQMLPVMVGISLHEAPPMEQMNALQQVIYLLASNLTHEGLYGLFTPGNWHMLLDLSVLIHLVVYSVVVISLSLIFGHICAVLFGLYTLHMKQSPKVEIIVGDNREQELKNKMKEMIIISSLAAGILSLTGDLFGVILTFGGALITVGYLKRCYEEIKGLKKVCPNCGSSGIEWLIPSIWSIWECRKCGYRGTIVVDIGESG